MEKKEPIVFYTKDRNEWRKLLSEIYQTESEAWLVFPMKDAVEERLSYNDAVEEALCFGWIDSTIRNIDELHRAQRFTPRKPGTSYSRPNIERLLWLESKSMILPEVRKQVLDIINTPYVFPKDILEKVKENPLAWENYQNMPEAYKRIRIAYIDSARKRPLEFIRRLESFIKKTEANKMVGYGGIEKYYV